MDFSDDVAYSVHDFEDAIVNGYLDASSLGSATTRADVVGAMAPWVGNISHDRLEAAWERLQNVLLSVSDYQGDTSGFGTVEEPHQYPDWTLCRDIGNHGGRKRQFSPRPREHSG